MTDTKKPAKSTTASDKTFGGFPAEERAAMKEHAQELKTAARRGTRRSPSTTRRTSTRAPCGRPAFALTELTAADEARIGALVKKAVS